ncbi:MAG TPA: IS1595 family transposase [Allosphingosinicella sp.]|nr:IS1595 family transposase [Allosphingosinicella sp.]
MNNKNFLKSAAARDLSLAQIFRLSDDEAYSLLKSMRWDGGEPVCPDCGGCKVYEMVTRRRFKCAACRIIFSLTSGTLFASYKRPLRDYIAAIFLFANGAKGVSALQIGRDLNVSYKTAFVLCHKLREAMAADAPQNLTGIVEIDGAYFGGHVREANMVAERIDRRRSGVKSGKRKAVVVARERGGRTATAVSQHESGGVPFVLSRVAPGTVVHTDEARSWDRLHDHYEMRRVNHQIAFSLVGCTNQAESFFSRLRRSEIGIHHHISGPYLARYAAEMAWREDHRRKSNGEQMRCVATLVMASRKSSSFTGYWQRAA